MKRFLSFLGRIGIIFLLSGLIILGLEQITFTSPTNWIGGALPPSNAILNPMLGQQGVYIRITFTTVNRSVNATLYIAKVSDEAFKYIEKIIPKNMIPVEMLDLLLKKNLMDVIATLHPTDQTEIVISERATYLFIVANRGPDTLKFNVGVTLVSHLLPREPAFRTSMIFIGIGVLSIFYVLPRIKKQ